MAREILSDAQVEKEIERLKKSDYVKLAQKEIRLKYKRRAWLYNLRSLEKRGQQLAAEGETLESLEGKIAEVEIEEVEE